MQLREPASTLPRGLLLGIGIYIPVMLLVVRPWLLRRQFAKRPDRDTDIEWRFSPDVIRVRGTQFTSELTWRALARIVQTPDGYLFYPTEQIFHWLPRHGFADEGEYVRVAEFAQQHGVAIHRLG